MSSAPHAPRLARSELNFFAESGLDRASEKRKDQGWIRAQLFERGSCIVPVWRERCLVTAGEPRAVFLSSAEHWSVFETREPPTFLGLAGETAYFAFDLSHLEGGSEGADLAGQLAHGAAFLDLRTLSTRIDRNQGGLLAYASGMMTWHRRHRFCGACGAPTESRDAGFMRACTNETCGLQQFPRTDPAVIMLVTHGDRCLLGRSHRFPLPFYSTLAGFVEPGETLEHAVAREVFEEAGVRVQNVRYHSSQPWPFPTSLMLGFYADAESLEIIFDREELVDCRWFERRWLIEKTAGPPDDSFRLPRAISIARRLLDDWLVAAA
jgi:NAD+ diphosphatase